MSTFDIVVVGGGPAGMMAAARAAQYGARVALLEKNRELGRKLMITGRGRCNFAHAQDDPEKLSQEYRNGGAFLLPALQKFGTKETAAFFLRRGLVSVEERGRRLYPKEGQDASSVVNALWTALKDGGVHVLRGVEVLSLDLLGGTAQRVVTSREEIGGRAFIVATGGLSFPNTGSTGDGYRWARRAGHTVVETRPALCPVKVAEHFEDGMHGLKLKNVRVTLRKNGEQLDERFGEMDFTPFGVSGAIIMDMASSIGEALKNGGAATLHIDLKPALEPERLDARIARDFEEFSGDALRFAVRKLLPREIIPAVLIRAGLDMGKPCGETTPEEREALRKTLKDFSVTPTELLGFRHAIITAGGVSTDEIDPETMRSRLIPNLYFAGEVLDVDGPTGGYNLQECWSTGFAAGSAAAEALGFSAPSDRDIVEQMERARNRRDEQNREERAKAKLEAEQSEADAAEDGAEREEHSEDMTIQTGPTDSSEFCGWRDPRKKENGAENAENRERENEFRSARHSREVRPEGVRRPRRERDFDDRPRFRDDRPSGEFRPRRERDFDDRPRFRDDRPAGEFRPRRERDFDERPRFRDDKPSDEFRPRRERNFDDRPRFRDDRSSGEFRPRRERDFDDRPRREFLPERGPRPEGRGFDDERRFPRGERFGGDRPGSFSRDRADRPARDERREKGRFDRDIRRDERGFAPRERRFDDRGERSAPRTEDGGKPRVRRFTNFQKFRKNGGDEQ